MFKRGRFFRKTVSLLTTVAMSISLLVPAIFTAPVYAATETQAALTIAGSASGVTLDGNLNESFWSNAEWNGIDAFKIPTPLDNNPTFATAWDSSNLYVGIKVIDANVITNTSTLHGTMNYNEGVEVFVDPTNTKAVKIGNSDKTMRLIYQVATSTFMISTGENFATNSTSSYSGVEAKHQIVTGGYNVEIKIPFSVLGITPKDGSVLGLEVTNTDDDSEDLYTAAERSTLYWNPEVTDESPATWGSVCLYNRSKPVISTYGTPTIDGTNSASDSWVFTSSKKSSDNLSIEVASKTDARNLYIAANIVCTDIKDSATLDFSIDPINSKNVNKIGSMFYTGYGLKSGSGGYDKYDLSALGEDFEYYDVITISRTETANGFFVEASIAYDSFRFDTIGKEFKYLDTVGFEMRVYSGGTNLALNGSSETWNYNTFGSLVFNYKNVAGSYNSAPTGNQISSHSIAKGTSLSGKITVTDPENDALTFAFDPDNQIPGRDKGTLTFDDKNGTWSYTTPSSSFTGIVNYYFLATDTYGNTFHQRLEIRVEETPTDLTYHVDGDTGNDSNSGLTKDQALKTLSAAHGKLKPGDTVLVYESSTPYSNRLNISKSGLPGHYITFKNAPGEQPVIHTDTGWSAFRITGSYVKLEGMTILGDGHEVIQDYKGIFDSYYNWRKYSDGKASRPDDGITGYYNANGLSVGTNDNQGLEHLGIDGVKIAHHIEIRNNVFDYLTSSGMGASNIDYVTIENNTITNNCWSNNWACSGISILGTADIDDNFDDHKIIVRNNITAGNRHFVHWISVKRFSDGNGIIIDTTNNVGSNVKRLSSGDKWGVQPYKGRILVANNLSYLNGGSGIHAFNADRTDFINNTIFDNSATPSLGYSDFYASQAKDINMYNNLVYSREGKKMEISTNANKDVIYDNNLFFNYNEGDNNLGQSNASTTAGPNNIYGQDPLFVNAYDVDHWNNTQPPESWKSDETYNGKNKYNEMLEFMEDGGFYIGADYTVPSDYDFSIAANSPAVGAANKEWAEIAGIDTENIGAFGTIGSSHRPATIGVGAYKSPVPESELETNAASTVKGNAITVDGNLSEANWTDANWYAIDKHSNESNPKNNNKASFAASYDDKNLYVAVKVKDATIVTENLSEGKYNNDGIEIFLDPNNKKYNGKYDNKVLHLMYQIADDSYGLMGGTNKWDDVTAKYDGVNAKGVVTADGYTVEAVFPLSGVGINSVKDGKMIGIEVCNNDDDNPQSSETTDRGILFWNYATAADNPMTWGTLVFGTKAKPVISSYGTPTIDGTIDPSEGWVYSSSKTSTASATTLKSASLVDKDNLYLAIDITGSATENTLINLFLDAYNTKGIGNVAMLQIVQLNPILNQIPGTTYIRYRDSSENYTYTSKVITETSATEKGYSIEIKVPFTELRVTDPTNLQEIGMEIEYLKTGVWDGTQLIWSRATSDSVWNSSSSFGTILLNSTALNYDDVKILNNKVTKDGSQYKYSAIVTSGKDITGKYILALYNGAKLVKAEIVDLNGDRNTFKIDSTVTSDTATSYKMMVLNGYTDYTPLAIYQEGTIQ